jgi:hypothetical protein
MSNKGNCKFWEKKNEPAYPLHWKDEHISMDSIIDIALPLGYTSNEGNVSEPETKLPHEHCTLHELSQLGNILRTSNSQNKAEMSDVVEIVVDNRVSDKIEGEKSESETASMNSELLMRRKQMVN